MEMQQVIELEHGADMNAYPVEKAKGAVVICPGGGYEFRSPREAYPVARAYNQAGYHAFVVNYQLGEELEPLGDGPLLDLGQAVAWVNGHKAELGIEGKDVYVCGFSAGAHLAATLGILWKDASRFPAGTDLILHRPDAMILCYPVVSAGKWGHRGSFVRLAGEKDEDLEKYSLEKLVTRDAVPAFLWHTAADESVPVQNTLMLADALARCEVPVEVHIFPYGVHGLSLATEDVDELAKGRLADAHVAQWMELCVRWMEIWRNGYEAV